MEDTSSYPDLMTVADVVAVTKVSEGRVRSMIRCGQLPHRRAGRVILVPKSVLADVFAPDPERTA